MAKTVGIVAGVVALGFATAATFGGAGVAASSFLGIGSVGAIASGAGIVAGVASTIAGLAAPSLKAPAARGCASNIEIERTGDDNSERLAARGCRLSVDGHGPLGSGNGRSVPVCGKVYQGTLWPGAAACSGDSHGAAEQLAKLPNLSPASLLRDARTALEQEAAEDRLHRLLFAWHDEEAGRQLTFILSEPACGYEPYQAVPVRKFLCWGKDAGWFKPFADKALTPADMREIVKLQMDNYDCPLFPNGIEDSRSDIVKTRIGGGSIEHIQLRLVDGEWREAPLGDGFGRLNASVESLQDAA